MTCARSWLKCGAGSGDRFRLLQAPDEFGSGFRGLLTLAPGQRITIEVLSNYQDVRPEELVRCKTIPGLKRVSLRRYLADEVQCVAERTEARDLVDIWSVLRKRPGLRRLARQLVARQDAALLVQRLLAWDLESIKRDLAAYPDADPDYARSARQLILGWLKRRAADSTMKKNHRFVRPTGAVTCRLEDGRRMRLPVVPGVLKHPTPGQLRQLLRKPAVARKYTREAIRIAFWQVLREFQREWLLECLDQARIRPQRCAALLFLLS
jgi:hypothetical protein